MLIRWLFLKKNTILVWNRLGVIVSMLSSRGVPSFQSFSNPKRAFVNDARIVKVYAMVEWPRMFRNVWAISTGFDIPDMFFLASFKATASFTNYNRHRVFFSYTAQPNSLIQHKWKILKSTTSLMLYELTTIPLILFLTSSRRNFPNHPHMPSLHQKNLFACFLNGLRL